MYDKYLKPMVFLLGVIIACAIVARIMSNGETLKEYGKRTGQYASTEAVSADN